jgi:hypothetical protein
MKNKSNQLTQEYLHSILTYDPTSGHFFWKTDIRHSKIKAGDLAGCLHKVDGYVRIQVNGKAYPAHRLAWLWMVGSLPTLEIDHIDHVRHNNRWSNLREVTRTENLQNQSKQKNNTSGFQGVSWHKPSSKWRARVKLDGKNINFGLYETPEAANDACRLARSILGFHENHGQPKAA